MSEPEWDSRPAPSARAIAWIRWYGTARLVTAAAAVLIVVAGSYWLLRTPPPPTEALLPVASTVSPGSTPVAADSISTDRAPSVSATSVADPVSGTVVVHVAGAVLMPGVFEIDATARVSDAVAAAGGSTEDGDPGSLNLAAPVTDGSRIYVPRVGEVPPPTVAVELAPAIGPSDSIPTGPLDVNAATADQLEELPGVGPATALAIITERERNGPFVGVDDLDRVPGIGPAKLEAFRDLVTT